MKHFIKNNLYKSSHSRHEFFMKCEKIGLKIYTRAGVPYGLRDGNKRYSFHSLNITPEDLERLDRRKEMSVMRTRIAALEKARSKGKGQEKNRER